MHGFSTFSGRALARARRHLAATVRLGRRPAALGAVLLLFGSTATVMGTANTLPQFTTAVATTAVLNEGGTVTVSGTFTDPDPGDYHSVRIRWDRINGNGPTDQVDLLPGQFSFQATHTYTDNLPPPQDITLTLYDRDTPHGHDPSDNSENPIGDERKLPIEVRNVAPRFVPASVVLRATASGVTVEGDVADPSTADTLQVSGTVSSSPPVFPGPAPITCTLSSSTRRFRCQFSHDPNLQPRTYTVQLTVRDDDGGQSSHTTTARFNGGIHP